MVYPNQHLYVTTHWTLGTEEAQVGMRFDRETMPGLTEREAAVAATATFWASTNADISSSFIYQFTKFALIQPDGLYPPDHEAQITEPASPVAGAGSVNQFPWQTAHVVGLTTAAARGRAHRGRIYLPPIDNTLAATGLWSNTGATNRNTAMVAWIQGLNAAIGSGTPGGTGRLQVFSRVGAGTKREVTGVQSGLRPDVQRRRAESQPENYVNTPIT